MIYYINKVIEFIYRINKIIVYTIYGVHELYTSLMLINCILVGARGGTPGTQGGIKGRITADGYSSILHGQGTALSKVSALVHPNLLCKCSKESTFENGHSSILQAQSTTFSEFLKRLLFSAFT
jgi:hypothetical protein